MTLPLRTSIALVAATTLFHAEAATIPQFKAVDVDTAIEIGYGVAVADMNGDKKPDIVLADKAAIVWYENPSWKKHVIAKKLTELDHVAVAARDINGDGKAEVAVGAGWNPGDTVNSGAVFVLSPGGKVEEMWESYKLHHEPTVHRMRWVKNDAGKFDLVVVPLHGRGNKGGAGEGVKTLAYHVPTELSQPFKTSLVDSNLHMSHNFNPTQWDTDGGEEILLGGKEGIYLLDQKNGQWSRQMTIVSAEANSEFPGAGEVRDGRLNKATRMIATVEPMHGNILCVYREPQGGGTNQWVRQVLSTELIDGHALAVGDLAQSGSDQIVVGWRGRKPGDAVGIKLYHEKDGKWESMVVDNNTMACEDLALGDFNGDGRLDIVAAGRATKNVKIYLNEAAK